MINYGNSMVRGINYVFLERFPNVKKDHEIAKKCEFLKNRRILNSEKIPAPIEHSAVKDCNYLS